jgi:hypothetical protein
MITHTQGEHAYHYTIEALAKEAKRGKYKITNACSL